MIERTIISEMTAVLASGITHRSEHRLTKPRNLRVVCPWLDGEAGLLFSLPPCFLKKCAKLNIGPRRCCWCRTILYFGPTLNLWLAQPGPVGQCCPHDLSLSLSLSLLGRGKRVYLNQLLSCVKSTELFFSGEGEDEVTVTSFLKPVRDSS